MPKAWAFAEADCLADLFVNLPCLPPCKDIIPHFTLNVKQNLKIKTFYKTKKSLDFSYEIWYNVCIRVENPNKESTMKKMKIKPKTAKFKMTAKPMPMKIKTPMAKGLK